MTELHLDSDEWSNILHALKKERDAAPKREGHYRDYLESIIMKIEIALSLEDGSSDLENSDDDEPGRYDPFSRYYDNEVLK